MPLFFNLAEKTLYNPIKHLLMRTQLLHKINVKINFTFDRQRISEF